MNSNIQQLAALASKNKRRIIGLMSGTSLDGLDIALCEITGTGHETSVTVKEFTTIAYDDAFRNDILEVFAKRQIDLQQLCLLNETIAIRHAAMVNACLDKWNTDKSAIDLIASHGQTVYHCPNSKIPDGLTINGSLQVGDGDHLAMLTGIITISDFRQKHLAAGGEGAPLALYGDYLLFSNKDEERILLNIGGIANFTYLPGNLNSEHIICTDTGPGNTLMDACMRLYFPGSQFDKDALVAGRGNINPALLQALNEHPFFSLPFPKSTGQEIFNLDFLKKALESSGNSNLCVEDILCTLNKFTADCIALAIETNLPGTKELHIYASGGGIHNPLLMSFLKERLPNCPVHSIKELGIGPDEKEAALFALLANECVSGSPHVFASNGKSLPGMPAISMGKISFPR